MVVVRFGINGGGVRGRIDLLEATGEKTKSKALDRASEFYLQMRGDTAAVPNGAFVELREKAEQQGSVTPAEIAEVLDTGELPVEAEMSWGSSCSYQGELESLRETAGVMR